MSINIPSSFRHFYLTNSPDDESKFIIVIPDLGIYMNVEQPFNSDYEELSPEGDATSMPVPYDVACDITCGADHVGDRRLPSIRELHYIFAFRQELNELLSTQNLPPLNDYLWAEDELSAHFVWYMNMRNGYTSTTIKTDTHNFRTVEKLIVT